ncbi:MAG TPA: threonine dehydratase [Steroidobacteraceae bacterium]
MKLPTLESLQRAARLVYEAMAPTPQLCWPQLSERLGAEVWVKHENHTPLGAFKIRGGLTYFDELKRRAPHVQQVIAATRGNHGQSIAFAAQRRELKAVIVVPHGNSREKNAAMRARGVELIEHGSDFQDAFEHAQALAAARALHLVPSFDEALVRGVATYSLELFAAVPELHTLYVPIGMGSGICGAIAAREALGLTTEIVGVVAAAAPGMAQSFAARRAIAAPVAHTIADGVAVRSPDPQALEIMLAGVARLVAVEESEIRSAMRDLFTDTHNVAEGAGALALAAARKEQSRIQGRRIAIVQSGANVDRAVFAAVLAESQQACGAVTPTSETSSQPAPHCAAPAASRR